MVCDVDPVRSCESLEMKLSTICLGKTVEIFENKQHFFSKLGPVTLPINFKVCKGAVHFGTLEIPLSDQ